MIKNLDECEKVFLTAKDVAIIIRSSEATAYRTIKKLNVELLKKGKIIFPGKINKKYFFNKIQP